MKVIILINYLIILHFSLNWSFSGLYLILVKSLDNYARATIEPFSVAHLLRLCSHQFPRELVFDFGLDLPLQPELIILHIVEYVGPWHRPS